MMKKIYSTAVLVLLSYSLFAQSFIKRQGKDLFYQGEKIYLRGMAFGNLVWDDTQSPTSHHSEIDFQRIQNLGMNVIRFYLNYKTFESDATPYVYKQSGWDWIDQNIQWAKAHNIFLILNIHIPQGGFQSQCKGDALWTVPGNQDRLVALWKAIADRYKNEPQIAGYDILNEPTPSGTIQNWSNLAQRIIDNIRLVDTNHLIITERAIALGCNYGYADVNNNYPQITETNLMYTVHLYDPFEFTHQNLDWANTGDGGSYPDENLLSLPNDLTYATGDYDNPTIAKGTTDWQYYTGTPFSVNHDSLIAGRVVFVSNNLQSGKVYFDQLEVKELDNTGNFIRTIYAINLQNGPYWWWSANNTGTYEESSTGYNDSYSVAVTGNTSNATVICQNLTFKVFKNRKYVISGWMKGDNVPVNGSASITLEFYHSPSEGVVGSRNYEYLKSKVLFYTQYIESKGFPVYFGEFGAARTCFTDDKGGERWVADAMHLFDSLGYHFTYHSYKESSFGYYDGWNQPVDPSTENAKLTTVFKNFFGVPTYLKNPHGLDDREILIYPNPASALVTITHKEEKKNEITIIDLTGKVVLVSKNTEVDVSGLQKGEYAVKVTNSKGTFYSKLMKQ